MLILQIAAGVLVAWLVITFPMALVLAVVLGALGLAVYGLVEMVRDVVRAVRRA